MKREFKGTPGPWIYQNDCDVYTHIVRPVENLNTIMVHLRQDSSGVSEANAHLISAAPELLAALENCQGLLDNPIARRRYGDDETYIETIKGMNYAINKAYGE